MPALPHTLRPVTSPTPPNHSRAAALRRLAGRFIVFDGPDGSGKTTQFIRFVQSCRDAAIPVCEVREPGGTIIGERIRDILLHHRAADQPNGEDVTLRCETLLYMASRAQLVEMRIRPALRAGELVLADRFVSSTLAYQGAAGGMSRDEILAVARVACGDVWPDLVVIFDVDEETAASRMARTLDRMESKGRDFQRRVREGYLDQARRDPARHVVIDASRPEDVVATATMNAVANWAGN